MDRARIVPIGRFVTSELVLAIVLVVAVVVTIVAVMLALLVNDERH